MKTVGIIGGLGPETTAKFYLRLISACLAKNKIARPPILTWNVPIPLQIEEEFLLNSNGENKYKPYLIDAAKRLEKAGADFIVIPCNSVHSQINQIKKAINIPVLNIIEETVKHLKLNKVTDIGILATSVTIKKQLFEKKLIENGINVHKPDKKYQKIINRIINNLVQAKQDKNDRKGLLEIMEKFSGKNIQTILLACTDLQLIIPKLRNVQIIDTLEVLTYATAREILA